MYRILVIDDCITTTTFLQEYLESIGFAVDTANDGMTGLAIFNDKHFDIVILDLLMPKLGGLDLCRRIRSKQECVPILLLSGRNDVNDKVACFEAGADGYMIKPFDIKELRACLNALLRLVEAHKTMIKEPLDKVLLIGHMVVDMEKRSVIKDGRMIRLTNREMAVLSFMARNPGKVISRTELLKKVWGYNNECYMHAVDTLINRLRGKIEDNPAKPSILTTIWGGGYTLNVAAPLGWSRLLA